MLTLDRSEIQLVELRVCATELEKKSLALEEAIDRIMTLEAKVEHLANALYMAEKGQKNMKGGKHEGTRVD